MWKKNIEISATLISVPFLREYLKIFCDEKDIFLIKRSILNSTYFEWTMSDMVKYRTVSFKKDQKAALYFTMSDIVHVFNQPTIIFTKKLSLYIQITNIYLGLGFEFGPQRIKDLVFVCP